MNRLGRIISTLALVCLITGVSPAWAVTLEGRVVSVTDGDTVHLLDAEKTLHRIRLAGIDAPEGKMAFGNRAKQLLSDLVFNKAVVVETSKLDRYGRSVGKILLEGGDANLEMIRGGMAWHFKAYQHEQSATDRQLYRDAEEDARRKRVGLWSDRDPVPPWEWRKR